jgi:hypothetical protein
MAVEKLLISRAFSSGKCTRRFENGRFELGGKYDE